MVLMTPLWMEMHSWQTTAEMGCKLAVTMVVLPTGVIIGCGFDCGNVQCHERRSKTHRHKTPRDYTRAACQRPGPVARAAAAASIGRRGAQAASASRWIPAIRLLRCVFHYGEW
jgi:hypothetical protein